MPLPSGFTEFRAARDDDNRRFDRVARRLLPERSLSAVYRAIREGSIRLNGHKVPGETRVMEGDSLAVRTTLLTGAAPRAHAPGAVSVPGGGTSSRSRPIPDIAAITLHSDDRLLFLDKPAGIPVHGEGGLDALVAAYLAPELPPSLSFRPGPLHRLDTNTSGVLCFSRSLEGARFFTRLIAEGRLRKRYLALVEGRLDATATWDDILVRDREAGVSHVGPRPSGTSRGNADGPRAATSAAGGSAGSGQRAVTTVTPLATTAGFTLIAAEIGTGRTHQIRAQAAAHGHPLAGDVKYGGHPLRLPRDAGGNGTPYLLHALGIVFAPEDRYPGLPAVIRAPLPARFAQAIRALFGGETDLSLLTKVP